MSLPCVLWTRLPTAQTVVIRVISCLTPASRDMYVLPVLVGPYMPSRHAKHALSCVSVHPRDYHVVEVEGEAVREQKPVGMSMRRGARNDHENADCVGNVLQKEV